MVQPSKNIILPDENERDLDWSKINEWGKNLIILLNSKGKTSRGKNCPEKTEKIVCKL